MPAASTTDTQNRLPHLIVGFGYLARRVAARWVAAGARVIATTRKPDRSAELRSLGVEPLIWDVLSAASEPIGAKLVVPPSGGIAKQGPPEGGTTNETLPQADCVLYSVGYDRSAGAPMRDVYVAGLRNTLALLPTPGKLIYISTTGVYGDFEGAWVTEDTPTQPADDSGAVCLEAEQTLRVIAAERAIPTVILRLAGIFGPGRLMNLANLRAGSPIAVEPDAHVNLIHVADAAEVIERARLAAPAGETYLVSDGRPVTRREFYSQVAQRIGAPEPTFTVPAGRRHRGDRMIANQKMLAQLQPRLQFANLNDGLADALAGQ